MEKNNAEQQKTTSVKAINGSKKITQSDANLPGINYKTRYYLAAKKRHCSNYSLNQSKAIASGMARGFAKCPSCLKWFCSRDSLSRHQKKFNHWTKQPGCICPICHKNFLYLSRRNSHMQCHLHDEHKVEAERFLSEITCGHCKKCFANKQQKLKHVAEKHEILDPGVTVVEKSGVNQPKNKQSVKRLSGSSKCNTKVKNTTKLQPKKPVNLKSSKKKIRCSLCTQLVSSTPNLNRHLRRKHRGVLQYQCSVCFSKFLSFLEAYTHKKTQHKSGTVKRVIVKKAQKSKTENVSKPAGKSSSVEMCSEDFAQMDSMDISDAIPKGDRLSCAVCNLKKFSSLSSLKRHENTLYHKKNVAAQNKTKNKDTEGDSDISILCSVCKEEFSKIHGFVLHRMSHFVSDCDVASIEADASYCYGCEICGDEIFGIKKVQFHLLWHAYTVRCARKSSEVLISRPPCSCEKSKSSARISLTCIDCKNSFCDRNEFVNHKKKCSNADEKDCLKYCIAHDTELCCLNDKNRCGNADKITLRSDSGNVECAFNSSHKKVELADLIVYQLSQPGHVDSAPRAYPPLTCSICGQVARSLKDFKEHSCPSLDESTIGEPTSDPSQMEKDSFEPTEALAKRLRKRQTDSSLQAGKSEHQDPVSRTDSFRHNLSNLLYLMISDEMLRTRLGWGKRPLEVIVEELLKLFGQEPCKRINGMTDAKVFRKNVLSFLQVSLKDTVMQELTEFDSIDSTVKNVLNYLTIFQPSIQMRD